MTTDERETELVAAWMKELAALPLETSRLPDPAQIWWKGQLLRQWDAQRTALAPLELGERVQVTMGLGGAALLLVWSWPRLQTLAAPAALTMVVLILTTALVAAWWRPSAAH